MLPICSSCKKIRNDDGYWGQIEAYIREHSAAEFNRGICPECAAKLYQEIIKKKDKKNDFTAACPMRVKSFKESVYGAMVISTTNEKMAQRIGRAIRKAFRGYVTYQWSHDNKLARVDWARAT